MHMTIVSPTDILGRIYPSDVFERLCRHDDRLRAPVFAGKVAIVAQYHLVRSADDTDGQGFEAPFEAVKFPIDTSDSLLNKITASTRLALSHFTSVREPVANLQIGFSITNAQTGRNYRGQLYPSGDDRVYS
jgi:hypothetical protein